MNEYTILVHFKHSDDVIPYSKIFDFMKWNMRQDLSSYELDETKRIFLCRFTPFGDRKLVEEDLRWIARFFKNIGAEDISISGEIYSMKFN